MRVRRLFGVVAVVLVLALSTISGSGRQSEKSELQGIWNGVQSQVAKAVRVFKPGEVKLVFDGRKLTATGLLGPEASVLEIRVDSSREPKEFDFTRKPGDVAQCIYEVSGDSLTFAFMRANNERPKKIDPTSTAQIVVTLRRQ